MSVMDNVMTTATSKDWAGGECFAVLPVGSFEQHGEFLPLVTDSLIAGAIAERVSREYDLLLLPPLTFSCSHEHAAYPGTVSISAESLIAIIGDVAASLRRSGIDRLAIVNGHGGNYVLSNVVQTANADGRRMTLFPARFDWNAARDAAGLTSTSTEDMHAGELEVSLLLHLHPSLVGSTYSQWDHSSGPRPHLLTAGVAGYSESGVIGQPSLGTAEKGAAILNSLTKSFKDHLALF